MERLLTQLRAIRGYVLVSHQASDPPEGRGAEAGEDTHGTNQIDGSVPGRSYSPPILGSHPVLLQEDSRERLMGIQSRILDNTGDKDRQALLLAG